ncbi:MAG: alpha/beta fold hydrolase [Bacteroidia bacterium]|nr:alpha/beta fold hydrolase [Bacteroidia bacterium]
MDSGAVDLHFQKTGEGKPLVILHGLFGLGDNWKTQANLFSQEGYAVYSVDLRNHGRSPHSDEMSYELMAEDLNRFANINRLESIVMIGHSMGGKSAMFFARKYPQKLSRLIVVDIAPRYYSPHHQSVIAAMDAVDLKSIHSRRDAEQILRQGLTDEATIQFLLKNLYWKSDESLSWRFNLPVLEREIESLGSALPPDSHIAVPTLFIRGSRSGYLSTEDEPGIRKIFTDVRFVTVPDAGHWVHAENPKGFYAAVNRFIRSGIA